MQFSNKFVMSFFLATLGTTQAMAADAIVLEPEPVEYVRICDAYGTGYFYLPGTETCMNINGYVRTTYYHVKRKIYEGQDVDGDVSEVLGDKAAGDTINNSSWNYRARLNFDVKNETEYGTLSSLLRIQGDGDGYDDAGTVVDEAHMTFAGFRAGWGDEYWNRNSSSGANAPAIFDGYYDDDNTTYAEYTYEFNGLSITGGVENKRGDDSRNTYNGYGGVNYKNDFMELGFTAVRDSYYKDTSYKASAIFELGKWELGGWYSWEDNGRGRYVNGNLYGNPGTHVLDKAWGVQLNGQITDNLLLYGVYSETSGDNQHTSREVDGDNFKFWTVGTAWTPVKQFSVVLEYNNERRKADLGNGAVYNDRWENVAIRAIRSW